MKHISTTRAKEEIKDVRGLGARQSALLFTAARYLPLLLAVSLFYTIVVTTVDTHPNLKSTANCIICKFTQNLSCGNDAGVFLLLSAPEYLQTKYVAECLLSFSKISPSTVGSRAPPFSSPSVEV
ncbi:MAG: hypothetical protein Q8K00_03220 [Syntrophales bacterium]|nr:hypothetical protein [Syntrophales bacterium]